MCGLIGFITNSKFNREVLIEAFVQSQIRGKHATGVSFYDEQGKLINISAPIPSKEFIQNFDFGSLPVNLRLSGHCRYSTSDLNYNQPLSSNNSSLVHNGVITQEFPEKWERHYGYKCETKNDSELLLRCLDELENPFIKFKGSSISAIYFNEDEFLFFRNGNRPLWWIEGEGFILIASTKNIIERTFKNLGIEIKNLNKCEAGIVYSIDENLKVERVKVSEEEERQVKLNSPDYYTKVIV